MSEETESNLGHKGVQSVARAAAILEIIASEGGAARLQLIAERAKLKKSTAHNILATLETLGYVCRRETDARYYLGERLLHLSRIVGNDSALSQRLNPVIRAIADRTGHSVFLAVPSGDQIYYIDGIDADNPYGPCSRIGARRTLEGSAIGLVFLAFIPELKQRVLSLRPDAFGDSPDEIDTETRKVQDVGYALDLQQADDIHNCVAVPVFDSGKLRASIAVKAKAEDLPEQQLIELAWTMTKLVNESQPLRPTPVWWPLAS